MNPFYQSVFDNIAALKRAEKTDQARALIEQELSVPYIPSDVQQQLEAQLKSLGAASGEKVEDSAARLEKLMKGGPAAKEKAVTILRGLNLRNYHPEVQSLLNDGQLLDEFKGELIRELIRQRVDEPFKMAKDGYDVEFNPAQLVADINDPVLIQARKYFGEWLSGGFVLSDDFAGQLLEQEVLETLPFDFSGVDAKALAASIVRLVYLSMKDEEGWQAFEKEHHLENIKLIPLKIEKRGD